MTGPFGEPGLPPAAVEAFVLELIAQELEAVPEEDRAAAAEEMLAALAGLRAEPAKPGETILFGEAAEEALRKIVRDEKASAE